MINDYQRELTKARDALVAARTHLARHAEMNAALHCAERVIYSPLHARVDSAITGIEAALARPADDGAWALAILVDLDRCEHGRHDGDVCADCGGQSHGNPHIPPGSVIGYGLRGDQILMPTRDEKHDPNAWRPALTGNHQETPDA